MDKKNQWELLFFIIDLYAVLLVGALLLRTLGGGKNWVVELVSAFLHWFLLGSIFLLPVAVLRRRWPTTALLSVCALAFIWLFGGFFIPIAVRRGSCEGNSSTGLRVMTYNISHGQASPEMLGEVIVNSGAEVVALQELPADQIPDLRDQLKDVYPVQSFHGEGFSGIALLSQVPVLQEEMFILDGPRPYLRAELLVKGEALDVIVAHPPVLIGPGMNRLPGNGDMETLGDMVAEGGNTVLMGDFNFTDQNTDYGSLTTAGLVDAYRSAGWGFGLTYPQRGWTGGYRFPLVRIDHIFLAEGLCSRRAWIGEDGGSDHLPVLADIGW